MGKSKKKFYVTTAIDYVNAAPHIGHAYQKIIADVLARWHRFLGEDVWFLTGTDEHGQKIAKSAKEQGLSEKEFVDKISKKFQLAWDNLNISYNKFIRTTDKEHERFVQEFIKKIKKDIYKGEYEGLYCFGCERFYTEKDLINGECSFHPGKKLEKIKEETYYFRLSRYQKQLLKLYENKGFVLPEERKNEIKNRVKEGLEDLSITRTNFSWGIPFPLDKKHVVYVWFDALLNYISGAGQKEKFWPANLHLLGKDNGWFHAVIWPAMLIAAGYKLPETIFIHGFLTFNGQKISKSLGNVISPNYLIEKYGADSIRYFACRNFVFGEDGDFSEKTLIERYNNELADKLGNLVSRVTALAEKNGIEKTKNEFLDRNLLKNANPKKTDEIRNSRIKLIEQYIENYELDKALSEIFTFIDLCNEYMQKTQPWKSKDKKILYELIDSIKSIAILLWPFIPETSEKIARHLKFKIDYREIKKPFKVQAIKKSEILFKKIEEKQQENKIQGILKMGEISFEEWQKLDLRVAEIKKVEDIPGADKLYKLSVDVGELGKRVICAGIKKYYKKEELKGKKIILFANLKPRLMKGIESQGMLLAAGFEEKDLCVLISPEKDVPNGSKIS